LAGNIRPLHAVLSRERFTVAEAVRALFDVIDAFDTSAVMARQIDEHRLADDEEQAAELEQVWQGLCDLLDQYVELLGDDETTREDFVADLLAGFETIDLAIVPPTVDAVLVGEIERVRGGGFGFVAVMGLSETVFPAQPAEPVLISDAQRRALSMSDLELQRDGERRLLDERYLLYHAVTRSAKSLLVTRPRRSEASSLAPSLFWSELRSAVPAALVRDTPTGPTTSRELAARIADWAHGETDDEAARWRAALPADGDAVWHATRAAFDYDNRPKLPADVATALFGASFDGSISRLEARALCAFRHFAEYGLQLVVEESDELTARDIGNLLHRAIELVVGGLIETGHDFGGDDPGDLDARVMEAVEAVAARLRGRIWMSAGRNRYERDRLGRELLAAVRRQLAFLRGGDFRPAAVEVPFGEDDPDWPAPSGDGFTLRGRIDRFDRSPAGLASVIDYKTNQRLFNAADVADGVGLQLPVYLLAADAAGHRPAGAFFVQLRRPMQRVRHPSEIADRPLEPKPRGVFDANLIRHFDRDADATSERLQYRMSKRSGTLHKSDIDPLTGDRLVRLLEVSRQVVTEVARLAVSPDITPRPWRRGTRTDSAGAAFAAVSRHEPRRNGYRLSTNVSLPELLGEVDDG
ncbi:MAG: PD-(D/E)XK nuclease family protein, partial [Planctomycetota bacterium]